MYHPSWPWALSKPLCCSAKAVASLYPVLLLPAQGDDLGHEGLDTPSQRLTVSETVIQARERCELRVSHALECLKLPPKLIDHALMVTWCLTGLLQLLLEDFDLFAQLGDAVLLRAAVWLWAAV